MKHHKPALFDPALFDQTASSNDPHEVAEAAHRTAAIVVGRGRESDDPEVNEKLIGLVKELGLGTLAQMWADRPARSLPGALWRIYVLHEWVQRQPREVAAAFAAGSTHAEVSRVIAGVAEPPSPEDLMELTRQILAGVFSGDLATALDRASAFCHVMAVGLIDPNAHHEDVSKEQIAQASRMHTTAQDLHQSARLWRQGRLL
ncbi:hypothetical protein K0651_05920 [Ornithinimicrobium sp. Arc0846-15]|nr:hypothetical protein [Ornithinimicrobium laminariae]